MASKEKHVSLEPVLCIYYPLSFLKNHLGVKTLVDLGSEVNAILLVYISKLGSKVHHSDIGAQKINGSNLNGFG